MSAVHSIPHPMEATSRDLVPSRYALRIGDIDAMVISDGVLKFARFSRLKTKPMLSLILIIHTLSQVMVNNIWWRSIRLM